MDSAILSEMIETRRRLHQHPEEGWTEFETTWLVYNRLKALGCESVLTGTRLINPDCVLGRSEALVEKAVNRAIAAGVPAEFIDEIEGYTGAAAVIDTGRPGPVLALRFDMDALCVEETTDPEHLPNKQGFCSQYAGLMHACGHDAHTALGLAVARWIMENRERLTGVIKLIFQPAEEGVRGANAIVGSGFVDDVDVILASHCGGAIKSKQIGLVYDGLLASTKFDIRFTGVPSHAGNQPQAGKNALLAACSTCLQMAGIPRHGDGATRVSLANSTPAKVAISHRPTPTSKPKCAVRRRRSTTFSAAMLNISSKAMPRPIRFNTSLNAWAKPHDRSLPGHSRSHKGRSAPNRGCGRRRRTAQTVGQQDYSLMLKRVVERGGRGAMFRWGCRHHGHHKSDFDIQDTETMPVASASLRAAFCVLTALSRVRRTETSSHCSPSTPCT